MFEGGEATVLTHDKESFLAGFCIVCRLCESFIVFGFKLRWKALAVLVVSLPPPSQRGLCLGLAICKLVGLSLPHEQTYYGWNPHLVLGQHSIFNLYFTPPKEYLLLRMDDLANRGNNRKRNL